MACGVGHEVRRYRRLEPSVGEQAAKPVAHERSSLAIGLAHLVDELVPSVDQGDDVADVLAELVVPRASICEGLELRGKEVRRADDSDGPARCHRDLDRSTHHGSVPATREAEDGGVHGHQIDVRADDEPAADGPLGRLGVPRVAKTRFQLVEGGARHGSDHHVHVVGVAGGGCSGIGEEEADDGTAYEDHVSSPELAKYGRHMVDGLERRHVSSRSRIWAAARVRTRAWPMRSASTRARRA